MGMTPASERSVGEALCQSNGLTISRVVASGGRIDNSQKEVSTPHAGAGWDHPNWNSGSGWAMKAQCERAPALQRCALLSDHVCAYLVLEPKGMHVSMDGQGGACTVGHIKRETPRRRCYTAPIMLFYKQLALVTAIATLLLQSQGAPAVYGRQVCTLPDSTADDVAIGS